MIVMNTRKVEINYWAVFTTGITSFGLSTVWYSRVLFGEVWTAHRSEQLPATAEWTMLLAPIRELIATYVLALLLARLSIMTLKNALKLALLLWLAFHAVGMAGAILWDNMPWKLGAVHAGDWFMKMVFMAIVLTIWQKRGTQPKKLN